MAVDLHPCTRTCGRIAGARPGTRRDAQRGLSLVEAVVALVLSSALVLALTTIGLSVARNQARQFTLGQDRTKAEAVLRQLHTDAAAAVPCAPSGAADTTFAAAPSARFLFDYVHAGVTTSHALGLVLPTATKALIGASSVVVSYGVENDTLVRRVWPMTSACGYLPADHADTGTDAKVLTSGLDVSAPVFSDDLSFARAPGDATSSTGLATAVRLAFASPLGPPLVVTDTVTTPLWGKAALSSGSRADAAAAAADTPLATGFAVTGRPSAVLALTSVKASAARSCGSTVCLGYLIAGTTRAEADPGLVLVTPKVENGAVPQPARVVTDVPASSSAESPDGFVPLLAAAATYANPGAPTYPDPVDGAYDVYAALYQGGSYAVFRFTRTAAGAPATRTLVAGGGALSTAKAAIGAGSDPAPDGTLAVGAAMERPNGIAVTSTGVLYILQGTRLRYVDGTGRLATLVGARPTSTDPDPGPSPDATPAGSMLGNPRALTDTVSAGADVLTYAGRTATKLVVRSITLNAARTGVSGTPADVSSVLAATRVGSLSTGAVVPTASHGEAGANPVVGLAPASATTWWLALGPDQTRRSVLPQLSSSAPWRHQLVVGAASMTTVAVGNGDLPEGSTRFDTTKDSFGTNLALPMGEPVAVAALSTGEVVVLDTTSTLTLYVPGATPSAFVVAR